MEMKLSETHAEIKHTITADEAVSSAIGESEVCPGAIITGLSTL